MFPEIIRREIASLGLAVIPRGNWIIVAKPVSAGGNGLMQATNKPFPDVGNTLITGIDLETDAPLMAVFAEEEKFIVEVANFVPGPGPGDFRKELKNEEKLLREIESYFFGIHPHFEAWRNSILSRQ